MTHDEKETMHKPSLAMVGGRVGSLQFLALALLFSNFVFDYLRGSTRLTR